MQTSSAGQNTVCHWSCSCSEASSEQRATHNAQQLRREDMRAVIAGLVLTALAAPARAADLSTAEVKRVDEAAQVLKEIHAVPDKDIPQDLWEKASCVVVVPSMKKAAFIVGGEYGKGLMSCRHAGAWSAPVFMQLGKGSWGLQIGAQSVDLVLLVMSEGGMRKLLKDKVSLGAEA